MGPHRQIHPNIISVDICKLISAVFRMALWWWTVLTPSSSFFRVSLALAPAPPSFSLQWRPCWQIQFCQGVCTQHMLEWLRMIQLVAAIGCSNPVALTTVLTNPILWRCVHTTQVRMAPYEQYWSIHHSAWTITTKLPNDEYDHKRWAWLKTCKIIHKQLKEYMVDNTLQLGITRVTNFQGKWKLDKQNKTIVHWPHTVYLLTFYFILF